MIRCFIRKEVKYHCCPTRIATPSTSENQRSENLCYGIVDCRSFSRQNGYIDADGTIRLYFTVEQVQKKLHRSRQSATRIFRELEYSGPIIRKKQGLGKPAVITLNYPADARLIMKEGDSDVG